MESVSPWTCCCCRADCVSAFLLQGRSLLFISSTEGLSDGRKPEIIVSACLVLALLVSKNFRHGVALCAALMGRCVVFCDCDHESPCGLMVWQTHSPCSTAGLCSSSSFSCPVCALVICLLTLRVSTRNSTWRPFSHTRKVELLPRGSWAPLRINLCRYAATWSSWCPRNCMPPRM